MQAIAHTVAFQGLDARPVEVQCAVSPGLPAFSIVGLPDKAVSEARERVRAAISALGLALPAKRITVNLSPADLPKEGSHFDLPIALSLLAAMDIVPSDEVARQVALGELSLSGGLVSVLGALPAAITAGEEEFGLICPASCGAEAAWVGAVSVIAPPNLLSLVNHFTGKAVLDPARPGHVTPATSVPDMADVKGQERAKRALEIAAAGRHHVMMIGAPGAGKSMMAHRMAGILPPLSPAEALETSMVHSRAGLLGDGGISDARPVRDPHHTASMAAIIGGGRGMSGAVLIAGMSALRAGAGLVSMATHPDHAATLNLNQPELMCHGVEDETQLPGLIKRADVIAIGPGLGRGRWAEALFKVVMQQDIPLVVDADGLTLLASDYKGRGNCILTPHPGEAARLMGTKVSQIQQNRFEAASSLSADYAATVVLKGAGTLVCDPAGHCSVNTSGNPGMASGGMGDCLTGIIAALRAQGVGETLAATAGVYIHGAAADRLVKGVATRGIVATDLLPHIQRLVNP